MGNELQRLQAQVEAQSFVIEALLRICVQSESIEPLAVAREWREFRQSPTFFAADAVAKRRLADELDAWADVLIMQLPERWPDRCRSRPPSAPA
ncbi:hypothetical protein BR1R5_34110 [Pseudomonas sp. BR1R-5]|nr:hypothetical protein BR1R5_34110 [Pseudomonas sp. BR1R-5]